MEWTETVVGAEHRAEGQYARTYRVYADGDRWRTESGCMRNRAYLTADHAKDACEAAETDMRKG